MLAELKLNTFNAFNVDENRCFRITELMINFRQQLNDAMFNYILYRLTYLEIAYQ